MPRQTNEYDTASLKAFLVRASDPRTVRHVRAKRGARRFSRSVMRVRDFALEYPLVACGYLPTASVKISINFVGSGTVATFLNPRSRRCSAWLRWDCSARNWAADVAFRAAADYSRQKIGMAEPGTSETRLNSRTVP